MTSEGIISGTHKSDQFSVEGIISGTQQVTSLVVRGYYLGHIRVTSEGEISGTQFRDWGCTADTKVTRQLIDYIPLRTP